jgi:hypothetical protein
MQYRLTKLKTGEARAEQFVEFKGDIQYATLHT